MYLLISSVSIQIVVSVSFTSHYVSINSTMAMQLITDITHLHPTMYLLIATEKESQ